MNDTAFWDKFWQDLKLPCRVDTNFNNDRIIAEFIKHHTFLGMGLALEVGCSPGKWMVFLGELGYWVYGIDNNAISLAVTSRNLDMCGVKHYQLVYDDFESHDFGHRKYDLIVSFGFIEHFPQPRSVIQRMVDLLKPGGILIIGVPNLTGLNHIICKEVDKTLEYPLLPQHNLTVMSDSYFRDLPYQDGFEIVDVGYYGGFEPSLFDVSKLSWCKRNIFRAIQLLLANRITRHLNCWWWSGYILAAYKKKEFV